MTRALNERLARLADAVVIIAEYAKPDEELRDASALLLQVWGNAKNIAAECRAEMTTHSAEPRTLDEGQDKPACDEDCMFCSGEACKQCGANECEHDVLDRHSDKPLFAPTDDAGPDPDGSISEDAARPKPSPAPADDVGNTMSDDIETVRKSIYNSGWYDARKTENAATLAYAALDRLAASLAQQDDELGKFRALAERAHASTSFHVNGAILKDLAALRREGV